MITVRATHKTLEIRAKVEKIRAGLVRANGVYLERQTHRLNQGYDVHGNFFKPYSPGYAKKKLAWQGGSNTWLRVSGGMVRSQKYTVEMRGKIARLVISFSGVYSPGKLETNKKGKIVKHRGKQVQASLIASANNKIRPFVGTRPQDLHAIRRAIFQY